MENASFRTIAFKFFGKKFFLKSFLAFFAIFNLIAFQIGFPLYASYSLASSTEETAQENQEEKEKILENKKEDKEKKENESKEEKEEETTDSGKEENSKKSGNPEKQDSSTEEAIDADEKNSEEPESASAAEQEPQPTPEDDSQEKVSLRDSSGDEIETLQEADEDEKKADSCNPDDEKKDDKDCGQDLELINKNDAEAQNESSATANTGNNVIDNTDDENGGGSNNIDPPTDIKNQEGEVENEKTEAENTNKSAPDQEDEMENKNPAAESEDLEAEDEKLEAGDKKSEARNENLDSKSGESETSGKDLELKDKKDNEDAPAAVNHQPPGNKEESQPDDDEDTNEPEKLEEDSSNAEDSQEIETGEAIAQSDIFNELNVNVNGENWEDVVINLYNNHSEDINLLEIIDKIVENEYLSREEANKIIENENKAVLENKADAEANSGENKIINDESGENNSSISTGNASATANIVNLVNKNIVGNNWVFAVINVFGQWKGDLVVPGKDLFKFQEILANKEVEIENSNFADIENQSSALSSTGGNSIEQSGEAAIKTGEAYSQADASNLVNTNILENGWFQLNVNNLGSWLGSIVDYYGSSDSNIKLAYSLKADKTVESNSKLKVINNNEADISNTALAKAKTGNNSIKGGKNSEITTGNAEAYTNIANLVNFNIVGNNWVYTLINIMGRWEGDLVFAYPDLVISIDDNKDSVEPGESVAYEIYYANLGRAKAKNVEISAQLPASAITSQSDNKYSFSLPELAPGEGAVIEIAGQVKTSKEELNSPLLAAAEIAAQTTEKLLNNNSDTDTTEIVYPAETAVDSNSNDSALAPENENRDNNKNINNSAGENEIILIDYLSEEPNKALIKDPETDLKISRNKDATSSSIYHGEIISHEIIIENEGEAPVYDIKLKDKLNYLTGQKIEVLEYEWEIGDLDKDQAVLVEYQILINEAASPGEYEFAARAKGEDAKGEEVESNKTKMSINLLQGNNLIQTQTYIPPEEDNQFIKPVPTAQAADKTIPVLGAGNLNKNCANLPLWIWISSLISYGLAVNWAIFPASVSGASRKIFNTRLASGTLLFSAAFFVFWYLYQCNNSWVPITGIIILMLHIYYKFIASSTFESKRI
ncbi:MAG: hypothetical protein U5L10_04705 [Candidatus Moranbacteria bacterium]|nr:hypothetical protein [Candidatus Moranbacteria bacterium]